jgi:ABC-type amino acid transport substrate-binding protein
MGFKYNYVVAPIEVSYDELVECVQNHTYEILMADLAITSSRTDKVVFSYPIYDNTMVLVVRKSKTTTISPFAFLKPFVWQLWLLIACGIYLFSALLIALYEFC